MKWNSFSAFFIKLPESIWIRDRTSTNNTHFEHIRCTTRDNSIFLSQSCTICYSVCVCVCVVQCLEIFSICHTSINFISFQWTAHLFIVYISNDAYISASTSTHRCIHPSDPDSKYNLCWRTCTCRAIRWANNFVSEKIVCNSFQTTLTMVIFYDYHY